MAKELTMLKKISVFNYKIKLKIKTTTAAGLKNGLKYSAISESNTCITEPSLEILPLRIIHQRTSLVFFLKVFKNNVWGDYTYKV